MIGGKYRVNDMVKYDYSEIWEKSDDEMHTDNPLTNNEVVELLNQSNDYKKKSEEKQEHIALLEGKIYRMRQNIKILEVEHYYRGQEGPFNVKRECFRLKQENGQLKKEHNKLKHRHSLLHDECLEIECDRDGYRNDVESLEKENEQLKKENEGIQNKVWRLLNWLCDVEDCITREQVKEWWNNEIGDVE